MSLIKSWFDSSLFLPISSVTSLITFSTVRIPILFLHTEQLQGEPKHHQVHIQGERKKNLSDYKIF